MYFALSCFAGVLILFFILTAPMTPLPMLFKEKLTIGGVFIFLCVIGIFFAIYPNWFHRYLVKNTTKESSLPSMKKRLFRGHHPDCSIFQTHTIHWKKKTWCAGCLGLLIGLCTSIVLMILYLGVEFQFTKTTSLLLYLLAVLIVSSVFAETGYQRRYPLVHLVMNSLLPMSFLLITIDVGVSTGQVVYALFTLLLCVLWLDTRIQLSRWKHRSLCMECALSCKMFTKSFSTARGNT